MDLNIVKISFELSPAVPALSFQQLYDAVRGFEQFFKAVSCQKNQTECNLCSRQSGFCAYRSVFERQLSTDADIVRKHQKPSLPYAFKIREIELNSSCYELDIVVIGNAIQQISTFRAAIELMLESVSESIGFEVEVSGAWCFDYQDRRHKLSDDFNSLILLSSMEIIQSCQLCYSAKIVIESPLKLLSGGSIAHSFDFGILLRSQMRRCSSLFAYYGEGELDLDYVLMSGEAKKVYSTGNSFDWQKPHWTNRVALSGIMGKGEFTGLTGLMLPLLNLGSYFNAGKGAANGMGVYRLETI